MSDIIRLNTSILPVIDVGTYGTWLGEYNIENAEERVDFDHEVMNAAEHMLKDFFSESMFNELGIERFTAIEIYHPRFYNYENDTMDFDLTFKDIEKVKNKILHSSAFETSCFVDYLRLKYKSYSGYMNYMPESLEDICDSFGHTIYPNTHSPNNCPERAISAYLMYIIDSYMFDLDDLQADFIDYFMKNTSFSMDDEDEEEENEG